MDIITITDSNLEKEHICCSISNNKDVQVSSKKSWLKQRFEDGLVFKKCDVRGKCFIEYIPAENAWSPIIAPNYMYINCLWVSGQWKGQGFSNLLLNECIKDSQEKNKCGLVILSAQKKMPFLSDPKFLIYKGFELADTAEPFYHLMYLPFNDTSFQPKFKECIKVPRLPEMGFVLYYTNQCPFTAKYVPLIENIAAKNRISLKTVKIETKEQAQVSPAPFTTYSLFYNGRLITNEILSEKKFQKIIDDIM